MELRRDHVLLAGVALLVSYAILRAVQSRLEIARFKKQHKCKPCKRVPQKDPILGLDTFISLKKSRELRISLDLNYRNTLKTQWTSSASILGQRFVTTCDPENIKACLATRFDDWGVGPRYDVFRALLGRGIFTADDAAWEHSRVRTIYQERNRNGPRRSLTAMVCTGFDSSQLRTSRRG